MISLESLCLKLIIQQFERFHLAFKVSNDEALKHRFEFLQRQYSSKLTSGLAEENFKDEYMEFLMNKHVKYLNNHWFRYSRYEFFMEDIFWRLPNLTNADFPLFCTDEILENIAKFCPKITEIYISEYSDVTDNGFKYLCKNENGVVSCPELRNIFIPDAKIADETLKYLIQNLPSLEMIDCPNFPQILYSIHKEDLPELSNVRRYNFADINLLKLQYFPYYADLLKVCLTLCPRLKAIACCISNRDQLDLFSKGCLEKLHLKFFRNNPNININDSLKINGCTLTYLKLYNCVMSISDIAENCPKLKQLFLSNVTFLHNDLDSKPMFHCLIDCTFQNTKDDNWRNRAMHLFLLYSPKLESISFRWCVLSQTVKTHILNVCKNHCVKEITFKGPIVELSFVREILISCPTLMTLHLKRCHFRIRESEELSKLAESLSHKPCVEEKDALEISDIDSEEDTDLFPENPLTWDDYSEYIEEERLNNDWHLN